jgi:hypothetical protein
MKKTAVEWLVEQLYNHQYHIDLLDVARINGYFEQAKEMFEKQIIEAHNNGKYILPPNENGEQYYNGTYGGEK